MKAHSYSPIVKFAVSVLTALRLGDPRVPQASHPSLQPISKVGPAAQPVGTGSPHTQTARLDDDASENHRTTPPEAKKTTVPASALHPSRMQQEAQDAAEVRRPPPMPAASQVSQTSPADPANTEYRQRRDRQRAENEGLQEFTLTALPPRMPLAEMLQDYVFIGDGSFVGRLSAPMFFLKFSDFANLTAASWSVEKVDGRDRRVLHATLWKQNECRLTVYTRTFCPGAAMICADPDGKSALNSWRATERQPASGDVDSFLDQVAYLFPDSADAKAFLDWLAHLEQRPGELPHSGWLHIAKHTGTGRNWLASLLSRLWRGYVAPNVDLPGLLESSFNGQLAGRVLAIVDEVQEGARDNPHRHHNKLNALVNAEFRDVNPKYGRQYREFNACRWLVFSNFLNALPLSNTDRRWRVVHHTAAPRDPAVYARLYAKLRDSEFINAVGAFLRQRDISGFNPGERPPMNTAKRAALSASKSMLQQNAEHLVGAWPSDVVTNSDAAHALSDGAESHLTPAMRRALEDVGASSMQKTLHLQGRTCRGWILRNPERWETASSSELGGEAARARGATSRHATALEVMHPTGTRHSI